MIFSLNSRKTMCVDLERSYMAWRMFKDNDIRNLILIYATKAIKRLFW